MHVRPLQRAVLRSASVAAMMIFAPGVARAAAEGARRAAGAPDSQVVVVAGTGACPRAEQIAAMLQPLARPGTPVRGAAVEVTDLGERWRVQVGTTAREYDDPTRDCAERARIAAVFVALALFPPEMAGEIVTEQAPLANAAPPSSARAGAPRATLPPWGRLEAAGRFEWATAAQSSPAFFDGGGMIRLALGWSSSWGVDIGVGMLASRIMQLQGVKAREQRFPFALGLRWRARAGSVELGSSAGLSGAWFSSEGSDLPVTARQSRVDLGLGALLLGRWPAAARLAPFISAGAHYFPRDYRFAVDGRGGVGSTAKLRFTGEFGLSVALE